MGATPPLEEFEAQKRLICSKMALHRAEISLELHEITAPYRKIQEGIRSVTSHPLGKVVFVVLAGFLMFSGKVMGRTGGVLLSLLMPRIRAYFIAQSGNLLSRLYQVWQTRRGSPS